MRNREFEDISIPKWKVAMSNAAIKVYRVFKNAKEFETIEAESVNEAISKSGLTKVFMVKSGARDTTTTINSGLLTEA